MEYISQQQHKPEAVIIPVNLRSFSPVWEYNPTYQFEKARFVLTSRTPLLYHFYEPLAVFRAVNANTILWTNYYKLPVYYGNTQVGTVNDFDNKVKFASTTEENIRKKFIVAYMSALKDSDNNLIYLKKTIDIANKSGIKVFLYITPVDYEMGEKYVGSDFLKMVRSNVNTVCSSMAKKNINCLDLSLSLEHKDFFSPPYPVEHLNQDGREYIAEQITKTFFRLKNN